MFIVRSAHVFELCKLAKFVNNKLRLVDPAFCLQLIVVLYLTFLSAMVGVCGSDTQDCLSLDPGGQCGREAVASDELFNAVGLG